MGIHRIQLKGPWSATLINRVNSAGTEPQTVTMPQDWATVFGNVAGTARFERRFHCPTNLDANEQVYLVFTQLTGTGNAYLNGEPLGKFAMVSQQLEFEVTRQLRPFNQLAIEIDFDPNHHIGNPGGIYGVVALEIRSI